MSTAIAEIQVQQPGDKSTLFQKGHPRYGGRQKGSKNRFGGDLREAVVAGIQAVGFIEKDKEVVAAIQETGFIIKDDKGRAVLADVRGHRRCAWYPHCEAGHAAA
jgi:hypothetical protein